MDGWMDDRSIEIQAFLFHARKISDGERLYS